MKKILLSVALAIVAPFAWAQVSQTTTTTTEGGGTITSFTPGNTIVLRESSGPRTYRFGKTVTYVTKSGKALDEDNVGDGGLGEPQDDELVVARRQGARIVGNHPEVDVGQIGQLQQPLELAPHDGRAADDAVQH